MIVLSAALVVVALILLVVGLTVTTLNLIYASIVVSLVALGCLLVGVFQRRGELPVASPTPAAEPGSTPVAQSPQVRPGRVEKLPAEQVPAAQPAPSEISGLVLVVEGRPRYHVEGCRYLTGKSSEYITMADAQHEGFTACGVCKPEASLIAMALAQPLDAQLVDPTPVEAEPVEAEPLETAPLETAPLEIEPVAAELAEPGAELNPVRKTAAGSRRGAVKVAAAVKEPTRTAGKRVVKAPLSAPEVVPAQATPAQASAARTAAARASAAQNAAAQPSPEPVPDLDRVVVIADRIKFHVSDCRFVRAAAETSLITRKAAHTQGYTACGVCKP